MVSGTTRALFGLVGWSVVPDLATKQILRILNPFLATYFRIPIPPPGTPQYAQRYRLTLSFAILSYLLYSLIQGSQSIAPNFYQVLGVGVDVDEQGLKAAFKVFAKKFHPDRPGVGKDGQELFMSIRAMFEALKDPVVRFAYDRFGPDVLSWEGLSTEREYLRHGLIYNSGYHIFAFVGLQFWSAIGEPSPIAFWRYLLYASLFVAELALLISPSPPTSTSIISSFFTSSHQDPTTSPTHRTLLHIIFPNRVAYQHILFLHHLFVFLSIALSRVAPQLFPGDIPAHVGKAMVDRLTDIATVADRETGIMLHTHLHSIHPLPKTLDNPDADGLAVGRPSFSKMQPKMDLDEDVMKVLRTEMRDMIVEANVKKDTGHIARAWKEAIARGRRLRAMSLAIPRTFTTGGASRPSATAAQVEVEVEVGNTNKISQGSVTGEGELPSPRPSPPPLQVQPSSSQRPPAQRRASSYIRARSVTY